MLSSFFFLAAAADGSDAGKAIALALGIGLGALGAGVGIGNIFGSMIQAVARQPRLRGGLTGMRWVGLALCACGGGRPLRPDRRPARLRPRLSGAGFLASGLIEVVPGLMIWTLIAFA